MKKYIKQCVCCGAPINDNGCEYCGALYKTKNEEGFSIELKNKKGILKFYGIEFEVTMTSFESSTEIVNLYVDNETYYRSIYDNIFTFKLEGRMKK